MNYEEMKQYLKRYLKARIPIIILNTLEKNRAIKLLSEVADELDINCSLYQMSQGISDLKTNNIISEDKTIMSVLDTIANNLKYKENYNFILSDISDIEQSTLVSRYLLDIIEKAETMSGVIILITNEPIWPNIQRLGITLKLNYPNETELEDSLKSIINT